MESGFLGQLFATLGLTGLIGTLLLCQGLALSHRLTRGRIGALNLPLRLSLAFASGLVLAMLIALLLACAGLLATGPAVVVHGLVLSALAGWAGRGAFAGLVPDRDDALLLPFLAVLIAVVPDVVIPPHYWDDTMYHLPYAREYLDAGGLVLDPYRRFPLLPHHMHLLFAQGLGLGGSDLVQALCWLVGVFTTVLVWGAARHWLRERVAAVGAVAVLLATPLIRLHLDLAYVDLTLTFLVSVSIVATALWVEQEPRHNGWLLLGGLAMGGAIGTKYFALPAFGLLGLALLVQGRSLRPALLFTATAVLVGGFWYARNAWYSGNPVHPIASSVFGYRYWDAADMARQYAEQALHGTDKTLAQLPLAAARISAVQLLAPALVWVWVRRLGPGLRTVSAITLSLYVVWFFSSQVERYIMPAIPLAGIVLIFIAQRLVSLVPPLVPPLNGRTVMTAAAAIVLLVAGILGWRHARIAHAIVAEGETRYLAQSVKGAGLMLEAGRRLADDPDPTVFQVDLESAAYHFPGQVVGDWFGPGRYHQLFKGVTATGQYELLPGQELAAILARHDADLLIIGNRVVALDTRGLHPYFETVFTDDFGWILAPTDPVRLSSEATANELQRTLRHR